MNAHLQNKIIRLVEREASHREISCTDKEATNLGLEDKTVLANTIRHCYRIRETIVLSRTPRRPGDVAGYRSRYSRECGVNRYP